MKFDLITTNGKARRGRVTTIHGTAETPLFMNVGTSAAIKGGVSSLDLHELGTQVELCNTYHLHLRPGDEVIRSLGGLHKFMNWNLPILTDSGGFQVFSLAKLRRISEEGVNFSSHIDGKRIFLSPETSMQIQHNLGADIVMAFDECTPSSADYDYVKDSCDRTARWLARCKEETLRLKSNAALFGINQGGVYMDLRLEHMERIKEQDLPGYAVGGLAVGEPAEKMYEVLDNVVPAMPSDKPRYLMGVGTPENIIEAVARGIDMFDCVMPSRNARHGTLFTRYGVMHAGNKQFETDNAPVEEGCGCPTCKNFSRAYIRHLFKSGEQLGGRLAVMHNLYFYNNLMAKIRASIGGGQITLDRILPEYRDN